MIYINKEETWENFLFKASIYCTVCSGTLECLNCWPPSSSEKEVACGYRGRQDHGPAPIQPLVLRMGPQGGGEKEQQLFS